MKKRILIGLICQFFVFLSFSQTTEVRQSDVLDIDLPKSESTFQIVGENFNYLYAVYEFSSTFVTQAKLKLVAFDKKTLRNVNEKILRGFKKVNPELEGLKKQYRAFRLEKTLVCEDVIYVIWKGYANKKLHFFVETYDKHLKQIQKVKPVHSMNLINDTYLSTLFKKVGKNKIMFLTEDFYEKDNKAIIDYKTIDSNLSILNSNKVTITGQFYLPPKDITEYRFHAVQDVDKHSDFSIIHAYYKIDSIENIHCITHNSISFIKTNSGQVNTINFNDPTKRIDQLQSLITKDNKLWVFGLFTDLKQDKKGEDFHGLFSAQIDLTSSKIVYSKYENFTKERLDFIFKNDKEDRKDNKVFQSDQKDMSELNSLSSDYRIEHEFIDNDNLVIFMRKNKIIRLAGYAPSMKTDNISTFKISNEGRILWGTNLDIEYPNNISVINFSSYYACLYTDLKQKVNFSAFNSQTGKVNSFELRYNLVNPKNAKKIDLYFNKFTRFDDKFYYFHKEKNNYVLFEMSVVLNE
jgi:hypothetical protein